MHLDDGAVQGHRLHLDSHDLFAWQLLKDRRNHPLFTPTIHACVDAVPFAKAVRQSPPFASLLGNIQNGIEYLKVFNLHVSALPRKTFRNLFKLFFGKFHPRLLPLEKSSISVNTP